MNLRKRNPHAVALGTIGGKSCSPAKARAARRNGKLGGRRKDPREAAAKRLGLTTKGEAGYFSHM